MAGLLSAPPIMRRHLQADEAGAIAEHQAPAEEIEGEAGDGEQR